MLEHYSHVRMAARRAAALDKLEGGLIATSKGEPIASKRAVPAKVQWDGVCGHVAIHVTIGESSDWQFS
jgi:hypothetical protein